MKVRITPSPLHNPGTVQRLFCELAVGPYLVEPQGTIRCQMTEQQRELFMLRGAAHGLDIIADPAPQVVPVPTMEEVVATGYSPEAAVRIIDRQQRLSEAVAKGEITFEPSDDPDPEEPPAA